MTNIRSVAGSGRHASATLRSIQLTRLFRFARVIPCSPLYDARKQRFATVANTICNSKAFEAKTARK